MLNNYLIYLGYITNKIQKFFEEQKEYICCSRGCSKCCIDAQFPYSEIEFKLILEGYNSLDNQTKKQVFDKINKIIDNKEKYTQKAEKGKFRYECPFLINNECSVYHYRGLICRTFGLLTFIPNSPKTPLIPFCAFEGLNYSNVLDKDSKNLSDEKFKALNLKNEPNAYNVAYQTLINEEIAKGFGFTFGEVKPLIDWFIENNNQIL